MKPLTTKLLAAAALALTLYSPSHALVIAEVGYGTKVTASTAGNCPSFCTGNQFAFAEDGGSGVVSATASESTYATARGSSAMAPANSYLPELKAYGSAGLGKAANVSSFASQMFTYSGSVPLSVDLMVGLTGSVSNNASGYASNTISADVAVVSGNTLDWFPSFASLIYEIVPSESRLALGNLSIANAASTSASSVLSFALNPGDSFFVVSQLNVNSNNGVADAEHTLTLAFDPVTAAAAGLVAVTAPIPELATVWMAGLGVLVLGWQSRRRTPRGAQTLV